MSEVTTATDVGDSGDEGVLASLVKPSPVIVVDPKHDFLSKLFQPGAIGALRAYVCYRAQVRQGYPVDVPLNSPTSVNIDLTSSCNYSCGHCVDMDILNTGVQYNAKTLRDSLALMHERGLRSVILIGGGEPTLYNGFVPLVEFLKGMGVQVGVVTNGTGMDKIERVVPVLTRGDWVRLSLDSASNERFQRMHFDGRNPKMTHLPSGQRRNVSLDAVCENVSYIASRNHDFHLGFSYIVVWPGARTNEQEITGNVDEIVPATELAKRSGFDYLSLKAFLDRSEDSHSEVVGIDRSSAYFTPVISRIARAVDSAKALQDDKFRVTVATNLRALIDGTDGELMVQPRECHMTGIRQVLGIRGLVNCPSYRDTDRVPEAALGPSGDLDVYATVESFAATRSRTMAQISSFDASKRCSKVVCMYSPTNRAIEQLIVDEIARPGSVDKLVPGEEKNDYFF